MQEVDEYIVSFPEAVQKVLQDMRQLIINTAPLVEESISYGMPSYKIKDKSLVYFAGYKKHIGFYALPSCHKKFEKRLTKFKRGKGSVQFPLTDALPKSLIKEMVLYRLDELIKI
jgi:uncharacterized protein YdhG (YjbR/CyaY superfamily)